MGKTIRKGDRGEQVKELQKLLNNLPSAKGKLVADGVFGAGTLAAVIAFQKEANLEADGIVGLKTWRALTMVTPPVNNSYLFEKHNPQAPLATIAAQYIGVKETGENLAGKSKELLEIFKADNLVINGKTDGYPWCSAFVSFCVQKLCATSNFYDGISPPREASVSRFLTVWAKAAGCTIFDNKSKVFEPRKGDIVVFVFSHIGIVEKVENGSMQTIEGNTNDKGSREGNIVARKTRAKSLIKAYIRLPVSTSRVHAVAKEIAGLC